MNPGGGRRLGRRGGAGCGRRWRDRLLTIGLVRPRPAAAPAVAPSGEQEVQALKSEAESLKSALEGIYKRIEALEAMPKPEPSQ